MYKKAIEWLQDQGKYETPKEILELSFWWYISSIVGILKPTVIINNRIEPVSFIGMGLIGSGGGKDFSVKIVRELFEDTISEKIWCKKIRDRYFSFMPNDLEISDKKQLSMYLPSNISISIEGTIEGLYLRALSLDYAGFGSLNIINDEILDVILNSNMPILKNLFDGVFQGKIIKADINKDIYNMNMNALLLGSPLSLKKNKKIYNIVETQLGSGIYRRSFIYYKENQQIRVKQNRNIEKPKIDSILNFLKKYNYEIGDNFTPFKLTNSANKLANHIISELIDYSNKNIDDVRGSAEIGSFQKIVKLSFLHAILHEKKSICIDDLKYAYDFYLRCRSTVKDLFLTEPPHKRIYKIIKNNNGITESEILEKDIFENQITKEFDLVEELAYRHNMKLKITGSKIKKYYIEPLPENNLKKLIISVSNDGKYEKSIKFKNMTIPFSGKNSLCDLVIAKKEKVQSFVLAHFDGTRSKNNIIREYSIVAFDIDDGTTLKDAFRIFSDFTYVIYTTKSHQKEKNGEICDRFRIVLPTKYIFNCSNDQYKSMMENLADAVGLTIYDTSTLQPYRLWFTNENGNRYINEGELIDITTMIPETIQREYVQAQIEKIKDTDEPEDEVDKRNYGYLRWFLNTTTQGNRNVNLFKYGKFLKDLSLDIESNLIHANSLLNDPISKSELRSIIRSASK